MHRNERMTAGLSKNMRIIEIGASHSPIVPKSDGWHTTVVDYADTETLKLAYRGKDLSKIEKVDVIWEQSPLHELFSEKDLGKFDAVLMSHSLEHIPNPLGLLQSCEKLLSDSGSIILALPDKRCCFDFFGSLTTSGDILTAHSKHKYVHSGLTSFNHTAYAVHSNKRGSWGINSRLIDVEIMFNLDLAQGVFNRALSSKEYYDFHAWRFTPASFELLILELASLQHIDLRVRDLSATNSQEFFVNLIKGKNTFGSNYSLNAARIALMKRSLKDISEQVAALDEEVLGSNDYYPKL